MDRVYGLTVDDVTDTQAILDGLVGLPRVTLRVVMDPGVTAWEYLPAVTELSRVADILLQPVDSSEVKGLRLRQYSQRFTDALSVLGRYAKYVEAGNEVNGSWLGHPSDVADKVNNALTQCRVARVSPVVTYYYDGDQPEQLTKWGGAYPLEPDVALVSVYPNSSRQRPSFDDMFTRMENLFPTLPKGFGEYGTEDPNGNNGSSQTLRANLVRVVERYVPPETVTAYIGGGFYWDAYEDVFRAAQAGLLPCFRQVWGAPTSR